MIVEKIKRGHFKLIPESQKESEYLDLIPDGHYYVERVRYYLNYANWIGQQLAANNMINIANNFFWRAPRPKFAPGRDQDRGYRKAAP